MKALRLPIHVSMIAYLFRFHGPRLPPRSCSPQRSRKTGGYFPGQGSCSAGCPSARLALRGREWDLSGLQAILPVPLLRSRTPVEPACPRRGGHVGAAPAGWTAKASAMSDFGASTQLWHSRPYASRVTLPHTCKACFRQAGCAFTGRDSNPLNRYERFQLV